MIRILLVAFSFLAFGVAGAESMAPVMDFPTQTENYRGFQTDVSIGSKVLDPNHLSVYRDGIDFKIIYDGEVALEFQGEYSNGSVLGGWNLRETSLEAIYKKLSQTISQARKDSEPLVLWVFNPNWNPEGSFGALIYYSSVLEPVSSVRERIMKLHDRVPARLEDIEAPGDL